MVSGAVKESSLFDIVGGVGLAVRLLFDNELVREWDRSCKGSESEDEQP
jgi:hypothetical protein